MESAPAGGAAATQVLIGGLVSAAIMTAVVVIGLGHRSGRIQLLDRAARPLTRLFALPGWALVPVAIALPAFAAAGFGFVWDVSIHIDQGRDTGPFGTPAHYFMLAGIYGFVAAGFIAMAMPREAPMRSWVRVAHGWYAPVSAVLMLGSGFFALLGFPLDDLWHRLFGQDVTLWGPTHQMMICGGVLNFIGLMLLVREGRASMRGRSPRLQRSFSTARRAATRAGIALSGVIGAGIALTALTIAWQQEFAYGVAQFRLLFQPLLIVLTGALVLVAARGALGRGAAIATAVVGCVIMGSLTLAVGPVMGSSTHHFPLYLVEAGLVEAVGLTRLRGYASGAVAGGLIGSVGVVAEWGWTHLWMPIPWPGHVVPEAIGRSLPVGIAAGLIGAWVGAGFRLPAAELAIRPRSWVAPVAALAVIVVSLATLIPTSAPATRVAVSLTQLSPAPQRTVAATVRFNAGNPDWLLALGWQGKEHRHVVNNLERIGPGTYRTTEPIPAYGTWKTAIRYARGSQMAAIPLYAPADSAIPAPAINRPARFTAAMVSDREFLQRERRHNVPAWLFAAASSFVALLVIALLVVFGWALIRIARHGQGAVPVAETIDEPGRSISVPLSV